MRGRGLSQAAASAAIGERLALLQKRDWADLAALPDWSTDEVVVEGVRTFITTYRQVTVLGDLRVVVQLRTEGEPVLRLFRARQVFVEGFELHAGGEVRPLRQDEMYDYN